MRERVARRGLLLVPALAAGLLRAQAPPPAGPLADAQLLIQGSSLTIYSDAQTNDALQTINVGEGARVRTCFGGVSAACGAVAPGDPRVAGLSVVGELSGPELAAPLSLTTVPGGSFLLPAFQREGDYTLDNVRLVETASQRVVRFSEPRSATLQVRKILLASATVTTLSLADLKARGIVLSQQNFKAFNFAVGFAFQGETVVINLPVLYEGNGEVTALDKPTVDVDHLPNELARMVKRWEPPHIVPFKLEVPERELLRVREEEHVDPNIPLFGAIVIPGNVSYLNQFFDARLVVANGAPANPPAFLANVTGALRLPSGEEVLRLAQTNPPVLAGQKIPVLKADGGSVLGPSEQGTASWTVEGLVPGRHVLRMEIEADLTRPGREPLAVVSAAQAAVEVIDARFNLTFNHPDVVREGERYTLSVTVSNLSRATQNLVRIELRPADITGASLVDPSASVKTIESLPPGASETLEFELESQITGKCVATTFQSSSTVGTGTIRLRTGVGELGIPLSPANLVLPRFTERLPGPLQKANTRLLGLAWSLAVAPPSLVPPGLPRVIKSDVERRAVDLGEAGQRLFLGEKPLESYEVLLLDQLGNRHDLPEFDGLRRALEKGRQASAALADVIRNEQRPAPDGRGLGAVALFDHLVETTSYANPFLAAMVVPGGATSAPALEIRRDAADGTTALSGTSDDATRVRTLPFGEAYAVAESPGGAARAPLAVVGRLSDEAAYRVVLRAPSDAGSVAGRLLLMVPNEARTGFRKVDFGSIPMQPGDVFELVAVKPLGDPTGPVTYQVVRSGSGAGVSGVPPPFVGDVALPPFRLIGAVQDFLLDRYGLGISYLFNRPPDEASAERAEAWVVDTRFDGDDSSAPALRVVKDVSIPGDAAFLQPNSERVVNVRYQVPISPLAGLTPGVPIVTHAQRFVGAPILDRHGNSLSGAPPAIGIEANHVGGLVDGRVLRGTGEPAANVRVQLIRARIVESPLTGLEKTILDLVGEVTTGANGAFFFPFVEEPVLRVPRPPEDGHIQPGFTLRALVPAGADPIEEPAAKEEVSSKVRLQSRLMHVNIALLGRGTVAGKLLYASDRRPAAGGRVTASSTLFDEARTVDVAADGSFRMGGLPVGPITLTGSDRAGNRAYLTVGIRRAGDVQAGKEVLLPESPGSGTVVAKVFRKMAGTAPPVPHEGARVGVYSGGGLVALKTTDAYGNVRFENVPEGHVSLQASAFEISRTPAFVDLFLGPGETKSTTLTLAEGSPVSVVGKVLFADGATNQSVPVAGAAVFVEGPGVFTHTAADGTYRLDGVPVQEAGKPAYRVTAIDFTRSLQGSVSLQPITGEQVEPIQAANILLRSMSGGVDGTVLDPLGNRVANAEVVIVPWGTAETDSQGRFSFDDIPLGRYTATAHVGDGLAAGRVGYIGDAPFEIVYGGHRPAVTIRMRGAGIVRVKTRTSSSTTGVLTPLYYYPTYYSSNTYSIVLKGAPVETQTDQDGNFEVALPLGDFKLIAANPFHGRKTVQDKLTYAGEVKTYDLVFEDASVVTGRVVDVDGVTPVPNVEIALHTATLLPQTKRTDALGNYRYELVPPGPISVRVAASVGGVDRVGRTDGLIAGAGQTLDVTVRLRAQGTVRGRILQQTATGTAPLPNRPQFYVVESGYPNRRLPENPAAFFTAEADGSYEVPHVFAGFVTVVGRDTGQVGRQGRVTRELSADWQILQMPDIVLDVSVGVVQVTVIDPTTGAAVPDGQVTLSNGEVTVSDANGKASFDALPLGAYRVYAFHAPSGRGGVSETRSLTGAGQVLSLSIRLDQRGRIHGTLFDDAAKTTPVRNGLVELTGTVNGRLWGTTFRALASTRSDAGFEGKYDFDGIPVGAYQLAGAIERSSRRGVASTTLTDTAPLQAIDLVLEPIGDVFVRLFEKLAPPRGTSELDPGLGVFSVRLRSPAFCPRECANDFTLALPTAPFPNHVYRLEQVLVSRGFSVEAQEATGEQRQGSFLSTASPGGSGAAGDPFRLALTPKGIVRVVVKDAGGVPVVSQNVKVQSSTGVSESATNAQGEATIYGVGAGEFTASVKVGTTGFGGVGSGAISFDDDVVTVPITLQPAVSAHGRVLVPAMDEAGATTLQPADRAAVRIRYGPGLSLSQVLATNALGEFRFDVLTVGPWALDATSRDGQSQAVSSGSLSGPNGFDNELPDLVLDVAPPRVLSIAPANGQENVSRLASVEIVFSEALLPAVLPSGANPSYFRLRTAGGANAVGSWSSAMDGVRQVVRFVPSAPYENSATHSIVLVGGPDGIRDLQNRPLNPYGNIGTTFRTSDTVGPAIHKVTPTFAKPVEPRAGIFVDFTEPVTAAASALDGDGAADAAEILWGRRDAAGNVTFEPLPLQQPLALQRGGYTLYVRQPDHVLSGDSRQRKLRLSRLSDAVGNPMPPVELDYWIWDSNAPTLAVSRPSNAQNGDLRNGNGYVLTPELGNLDLTPISPAGDVDRVEYALASATDPTKPAASPSFTASAAPFAFSFTAAYSGDGAPRPFKVWVTAYDTSTNKSNQVLVDMQVLPNAPPAVPTVTAAATAPVAGTPYAGSTVEATVGGLSDTDDNTLTVRIELRRDTGDPANPSALLAAASDFSVTKPAAGWSALAPQKRSLAIPLATAEGASLFFRVRVIDSRGIAVTSESDRFAVADDAAPASISAFVAKLSPGGAVKTAFTIGQRFTLEFKAQDAQTAVKAVSVAFDGIFTSPVVPTFVSGTLYRTPEIAVPSGIPSGTTPVLVTASAEDWGGNTATQPLTLTVAPTADPTTPVVTYLSPFLQGQWPADYASVSPGGTPLLLRVQVSDKDRNAQGQEVPGTIVSVEVRGPVDAQGTLDPVWRAATLVAGSNAVPGTGVYQLPWTMPNGVASGTVLAFEARVRDAGNNEGRDGVELLAVPARHVYERVNTAVIETQEVPTPAGTDLLPVFLLDGSVLSLYPTSSGPRAFGSLYAYPGWETSGTTYAPRLGRLVAPEVASYASAIAYYPLEIAVADTLGLAGGTSLDMTARGLLGNTGAQVMSLAGEPGPERLAGGSHGGLGGFAAPSGGFPQTTYNKPGVAYDDVRDPRLPGQGGGAVATGTGAAGKTGGGVIRVLAGGATVRLYGSILADAEATRTGSQAGGAGGAIKLVARTLVGPGRVSANGSAGQNANQTGGGGGGRVAISYEAESTGAIPWTIEALGGPNAASGSEKNFAGAGTIYLETLDPATGQPAGAGRLLVSNRSGKPAWPTLLPALSSAAAPSTVVSVDVAEKKLTVAAPAARASLVGDRVAVTVDDPDPALRRSYAFPIVSQARTAGSSGSSDQRLVLGVDAPRAELSEISTALSAGKVPSARSVTRYAAVDGKGAARLVFDAELEVGTAEPFETNSRASLTLDAEARALLAAENPVVTFTATPPAGNVKQGAALSLAWTATDPLGLSRVETSFSLTGAATADNFDTEPTTKNQGASPITATLSTTQAPGPITYRVKATDRAGRVTDATHVWTVVPDTTPPTIDAFDLAPVKPNDTYRAGDGLTITVRASDDVKLATIKLTVASQTTTKTASPATFLWTAPAVASQTPFELRVEASDLAGNVQVATRTVLVDPLVNPGVPTVTFDCPTTGATLPSGYAAFQLQATATDDVGVLRVEFFRDLETTPFATSTPASGTVPTFAGTATTALPTVSSPTAVVFRARAYDASGNVSADATAEILVVPAVEILASGANDWAALATQVGYLRTGTLVVDQPRTLGGLLVLRGATVTHSQTSPSAEKRLDLTVNGPVYLECGASIDASGKGYAPGATLAGATPSSGGSGASHIGRGGPNSSDQIGTTYGSVVRPLEAGAGATTGYTSAGSGGGVVKLTVERLTLESAASIKANGGTRAAGGSVWIGARSIAGAGAVEARGADATNVPAGGGGAISIDVTDSATGSWESRLDARGGAYSNGAAGAGGAGTIVVRRPGGRFGDLVVDSRGSDQAVTILPSLGSGTAQAGSSGATLATGAAANLPAYFVGHWVELRSSSAALKGTYRVESISGTTVTLLPNGDDVPNVSVGDLWQGVYRFDAARLTGTRLRSADPIRVSGEERLEGKVETRRIDAGDLVVAAAAVLTHPASTATVAESLVVDVSGTLRLEGNASIDATRRGYPVDGAYPGATPSLGGSGASHLGRGGANSTDAIGATYGSVTRPQEAGTGAHVGYSGSEEGGGIVRIAAGTLILDAASSIKANGGSRASGGSVWIATGTLAGDGAIEARAADTANVPGGGGGAIAVEVATATSGTWETKLDARGGKYSTNPNGWGGAGTILVKRPASVYGELIVDTKGQTGQTTLLPSLGGGVAQAGSAGATLQTGRSAAIPAYFVGHWVEVRDALGVLKGTWRIAAISGGTLTLSPDESAVPVSVPSVIPGDAWQAVYRFDAATLRGARLQSADPIRVTGTQTIEQTVETRAIQARDLTLKSGAVLTHPASTATVAESLVVDVSGTLRLEGSASIDVTRRGYLVGGAYPDAAPSAGASGASHLGRGGANATDAIGATYGSVTRPQEAGTGAHVGYSGSEEGGGIVRIAAGTLILDAASSIKANGGSRASGGSVWITTGTLVGDGTIEARGADTANVPGGGGGAIAVEVATATSGTWETKLDARGGKYSTNPSGWGGAGTILVKRPTSVYGELIVDTKGQTGQTTLLPSLGGGVAQAGSAGATLQTGRSAAIPAYFVGHWVEVRDALGVLKGTWRIAAISGGTLTLSPDESAVPVSVPSVIPGDTWQAVYRFDAATLRGARLQSADPIRVTGTQTIEQTVETRAIQARDLTLKSGAVLTHPASTATVAEALVVDVSGTLRLEGNASIDATRRGYPVDGAYPGATPSSGASGASHLGRGGANSTDAIGATYGSVTRPQEAGTGAHAGYSGSEEGGGIVRIAAGTLILDAASSIKANGGSRASGGSVWIATGTLAGDGAIEARGADTANVPGGGGGAIAVEVATATSGTWETKLDARGGKYSTNPNGWGGAGTILVKRPASAYGELIVDGKSQAGQATVFPSLGNGTAQAGSSGATLVTNRVAAIPAYFVGHWVEVRDGSGGLKGTWPVKAISNVTLTLDAFGGLAPNVTAGDAWQGVYRFDRTTRAGGATLQSADPIRDVPPTIAITAPAPNASVAGGASLTVTFTTTDDAGVAKVDLALGTSTKSVTNPSSPATTALTAPNLGTTQTLSLVATVTDLGGNTATTSVPVVVLGDPLPSVTITQPLPNAPVRSGSTFSVQFTATDNASVASVRLTLGTSTQSTTGLSGTSVSRTVSMTAPVVTVSTPMQLVAVATDNAGGQSDPYPVPVVVNPDQPPTLAGASCNCGGVVPPGSSFSVRYEDARDDAAVTGFRIRVTGAFTTTVDKAPGTLPYGSTGFVSVPTNASGIATVSVTALDAAGHESAPRTFTFEVVDLPPTLPYYGAPESAHRGESFTLALEARDDVGLARLKVRAFGSFPFTPIDEPASGTYRQRIVAVTVPATAAYGAETFVVTLVDTAGNSVDIGPITVPILESALRVELLEPAEEARVFTGDLVNVAAAVETVGADALQSVTVTFGSTVETISPPETYVARSYAAPSVAAPSPLLVKVEARDVAGRVAVAERTIEVRPASRPFLELSCPTDGALLPVGAVVPLSFRHAEKVPAGQFEGLARVEFYLDSETTPFAVAEPNNGFEASLTVPSAASGTVKTLRAVLYDVATTPNTAEATISFTVVSGTVIDADEAIGASDVRFDGQTVIVASGTTTISGPHTFARLVVLPYATVVPAEGEPLELTVTGDVYVACGASIYASGQGFLGGLRTGNPSTTGLTRSGLTGSAPGAGGSYGGRGGNGLGPSGPTYGSFLFPADPGSGSGAAGVAECGGGPLARSGARPSASSGAAPNAAPPPFEPGENGGGLVTIQAGRLVMDGFLSADGGWDLGQAGGAGGGVRLSVSALSGGGVVSANGTSDYDGCYQNGAGGGGRIAVYGDASSFRGLAATGGGSGNAVGGAGTIFVKGPADARGRLTVKSGARKAAETELVSIGGGTIQSVSGAVITDGLASFGYGVEGLHVDVKRGATPVGRYLVTARSADGRSLTLEAKAAGEVLAGDTYQGVVVLDAIAVQGGATLKTRDVLAGSVTVDSISRVDAPPPPPEAPPGAGGAARNEVKP